MSGARDFITPAESDCLAQIESERNTTKQELENIQHIVWLNFQDSAHFTAALCKDRSNANSNLVQYQFQQCAIAVTRLYKDSVDAVERAFALGQQHGNQICRRDLSSWAKRKKRKINRLDLLRQLARRNSSTTPLSSDNESDDLSCVLSSLGVASPRTSSSSLGVASPRASSSSSHASPRSNVGEPSGLQPRQGVATSSPPSTPPHSSHSTHTTPYVSRKRKAESLLDEFLETVHSVKRTRQ